MELAITWLAEHPDEAEAPEAQRQLPSQGSSNDDSVLEGAVAEAVAVSLQNNTGQVRHENDWSTCPLRAFQQHSFDYALLLCRKGEPYHRQRPRCPGVGNSHIRLSRFWHWHRLLPSIFVTCCTSSFQREKTLEMRCLER